MLLVTCETYSAGDFFFDVMSPQLRIFESPIAAAPHIIVQFRRFALRPMTFSSGIGQV